MTLPKTSGEHSKLHLIYIEYRRFQRMQLWEGTAEGNVAPTLQSCDIFPVVMAGSLSLRDPWLTWCDTLSQSARTANFSGKRWAVFTSSNCPFFPKLLSPPTIWETYIFTQVKVIKKRTKHRHVQRLLWTDASPREECTWFFNASLICCTRVPLQTPGAYWSCLQQVLTCLHNIANHLWNCRRGASELILLEVISLRQARAFQRILWYTLVGFCALWPIKLSRSCNNWWLILFAEKSWDPRFSCLWNIPVEILEQVEPNKCIKYLQLIFMYNIYIRVIYLY